MSRRASQLFLTAIVLLLGLSQPFPTKASTIFLNDLTRAHEIPSAESGVSESRALEDEPLMLDASESPVAQAFAADLSPGAAAPSHASNLERQIKDQLASVPETGRVCLLGLGLLALARGLRGKLRG